MSSLSTQLEASYFVQNRITRVLGTRFYPALHMTVSFLKVLVHGEANEMGRLMSALNREYEDNPDTTIEIHNPKNTQSVNLYFR